MLFRSADAFIGTVINAKSNLLVFVNNGSASFVPSFVANTTSLKSSFSFNASTSTAVEKTGDELAAMYADVFSDIEAASSTILIDPGTLTKVGADNVLKAAAVDARGDLTAVVGYPTASVFSDSVILTYKQTLTPNQFGAFYATRELVTINGVDRKSVV